MLMLVAGPAALARAEQALPAPVDRPDMAADDGSETRLFAPIPRWEAPPPPPDPVLATPSFMAPTLNKQDAARQRAERNGFARPEIDATAIRRGLGPAASPLPAASERAVGVKLGAEQLSVSTAIVTGQGGWQRNDTRLDWNVSRGSAGDANLRWSAATGGNLQASGSAGQNAEAVLGYRLQPLDIVTLTTEIALAGNYTFAVENGLATNMTPRVKVLADLTQPLSMPWRTTLDLNLGRQVPLIGNSFQTNAAALLRLELPTP
ncbi:MAG TPA: hypothetical protein VGN82_24680 [Bosea sp. (in: a-proteobacteria)]|uniref:hypothetical protein n=1 Tax=Bosea sp. (in: a-proteobacteria) TaxID=1871050 RepID=UPI002E13A48B|nr:hypothetical protein [Bosea sp. (in: a-proteobacteria)]